MTTGTASIRRQLTRSATVELAAIYGDSRALDQASSTFSEIKSASGSLVWVQRMGRSFSATLGYARDYQQQAGAHGSERQHLSQSRLDHAGLPVQQTVGKVMMAEEFSDEQPQAQLDLGKYWDLVVRRRWHLLLPFFLGWIAVWGASWFLPSVYRSGTLILVEQPSVSKDLVPTNCIQRPAGPPGQHHAAAAQPHPAAARHRSSQPLRQAARPVM